MGLIDNLQEELDRGLDPDTPRKTGGARFMELTLRQGWSFWATSLFFCVSAAPGALLTVTNATAGNPLGALLGGALGGLMSAPWYVVLQDAILRAMRDDVSFWWPNCKKTLKASGAASLLPGLLSGLVTACQIYVLISMLSAGSAAGWALLFLSILASSLIHMWFWPQLTLMSLPFGTLLKNSLKLVLAFPGKSLLAAAVTLLYWGAVAALLPYSLMIIPLLGPWYVVLAGLMLLYPVIDQQFQIEERLKDQEESR